ncbi:hypothetical protein WN943_015933 [Citrus x changshan-huyou]
MWPLVSNLSLLGGLMGLLGILYKPVDYLFIYFIFVLFCFTVGGSRQTSVIVVTLDTGEVYIVTSLYSRTDTQVIYVDPTTGALRYHGNWGYDVFGSENEAVDYITNGSRWMCKSTTFAKAILGYTALGSFGLLLVATRLTASIPNLPGGGTVCTVTESQWIKIPLQNPQPQGKGEVKNVQELPDLDIDGKHYFCETRDITRPFPSRMPLQNPDEEFVWNEWLSMPFKSIGLPQHCVILLQGFAECRNFGRSGQLEGVVALIARRSRLHPGTRYLARGINSCFSTGNEAECEQLVWIPKRSGQSVPFNAYIWRRGTIPIWWGAELKLTAAEAEIYVADRDPYKGSLQYYQRLSNRYDARNFDLAVGENQKKKPFIPIVCINLLRNAQGKSESILVQHFEESLNYVRSTGKLPYTRIILINYDWHASTKLKDSLDRTNAASYFGALQVFAEQCRRLGVSLDSDFAYGYQSANNYGGYTAPLPRGWEKRADAVTGKTYYIDHNTRTTTWIHPCPDKPWKRFDMTFEEFKQSTILSPVSQLADLFLLSGDIHATLYTGSKAMHSQILNIFNEEPGKFKQFSAAQNMKITLQRRYKNAVVDSSRQKQLEMFLGLRLFKHLPSVSVQPLHVLSRPSGFFLKPVPNMFPSSDGGASLLSFKRKDMIWGASIPRCGNGTNLLIPLPGSVSAEDMAITGAGARLHDQDAPTLPLLYDFEELEGELDLLTRFVAVTFYPAISGTNFMEAMKLEIERLQLNLSAAERDRALLSIGTDPASINPNVLLDESYMGRLCRIANTLALLGQASLEDKIVGAIGLENSDDSVLDFWNITRIGESCSGGGCEVRAETKVPALASSTATSVGSSQSPLLCSQCERKVCKVCCAGRGALLFSNYKSREVTNYNGFSSQSGSSHGSQVDVSTSRSLTLDGVICKHCCHEIVLDALMLDYVRVLISLRRSSRADNAAYNALNEVVGSCLKDSLSERIQSSDNVQAAEVLHQLYAKDSAPILSLLAPLNSGSRHSYWRAPPSTTSVEFVIVLGSVSDVSGVILLRPGSASVNFGKDLSLLSLDEDENPFAQVDRRASFGGAVENEPCIHAKRILVVGSPVKREGLTTSQSSEQLSIRNWLDRAPQMSRFKVPIEAERLMDYDLVLEQYLPPASPSLAGFRLDAFSAIKPRVTHSPSSDSDIWDKSVTFLEVRYISQAVLYLQVSALQEPYNMVTIAEYRLPEARAGTPMYFDFPRPIQSRRVSFKLLGDVTAFADEPSEQDDSGLRAPLVATGLSLSNRIKLYYYCDPYELGKWASLSGV